MAGAALALSTVVGLALTARAYNSAKRQAVASVRDSARQAAGTLDRDLGQAAMLVALIAPGISSILEQAGAVAANPEVCSLKFAGIGVFPSDGAIHIVTNDGRVLCSSAKAAIGQSYAAAPWFARLAAGEPVIAGDSRDAVRGEPVAVVASPIRDASGAVGGALLDTIAMRSLAPVLAETFGGPNRRAYTIVDSQGQVVSSSVDVAEQGRPFPRISDGGTAPDSRGTKRIWGVGEVKATGWRVWAGPSEARLLGPAQGERRRLALVLVIALAAAVGLALLVNRRLVRPLRGLSATVGQAETEPDARATVEGPAELADLARGLNRMLATRQRNEKLVADLAAELEATANSLVEAREQERQSLAIALHDTTLQGLIAVMWQVDTLAERTEASPALERLRRDLEALVGQTRAVTTELRPPALAETGLGTAVDELAHRTAGEANLAVEVEDRLAGARFAVAVEMLVYRMVQEALQNVRKHARATKVRIVLERDEEVLRAIVADDGVGVDQGALEERVRAGHFGVVSMRDTARLAKGRFSITRGDPVGTVVEVEIPVTAAR